MFRAYDKNGEISYSLGAFPTVELIKRRSEDVLSIALHSKLRITDEVEAILESVKDKVITSDRAVERVAKKGIPLWLAHSVSATRGLKLQRTYASSILRMRAISVQ